ncbi:hypothetical protein DFJ73DRAFT_574447 [Zopfochytrium polystomum]|nr:hypothetical protein DFJ73DRAFT_574447 [Zopfochytrium polystomum]
MSSFLSSIVSALVPSAVSQPDRPSSRSSQPAVTSPKAASQDTTGRSFGGLPFFASSPIRLRHRQPPRHSSTLSQPSRKKLPPRLAQVFPSHRFPFHHIRTTHTSLWNPRTEALDQAGADRSGGENEKEGSPDDARLPRPPDLDIESSAYPYVGYHGDSPRRSSVKVGHSKPSKKYSARAINSKLRSAASMAVMANVGKQNGLDSNLKDEMRNHLKLMLRQVLGENSPVWETVLMNLAIVAAQTVVPDVGSYNVKNCVKIKKIPGGEAADSRYIDGLVCSGNVMHKRMQRDLQLPRVVLLNFSLEYQKPTELTRAGAFVPASRPCTDDVQQGDAATPKLDCMHRLCLRSGDGYTPQIRCHCRISRKAFHPGKTLPFNWRRHHK